MDPFDLADRQLDLDRAATLRHPALLDRKRKRLVESPFGFFRGSARLYYEIVASRPRLALDEPSVGAVVGDMHLENVGAYRNDEDEGTFGLNDFDDAAQAPLWFDVLRLSTSVVLAARTFHASATEALSLVDELLVAYDVALTSDAASPPLPKPIAQMCERAARRTRKELLDMRAPARGGKRSFERGARYFDLDDLESAAVPELVDAYRAALGSRAPAHAADWRVVDAAYRIAGNGSLGRRRIALLVADKDGVERIFELKEAVPSAVEALSGPDPTEPATRVVESARALTATPPRQLAALPRHALGSFAGRKLCPDEDKLELAKLSVGPKLSLVVATVGAVLGKAHRRGARGPLSPRTPAQRDALVDRAVRLAGIFESVYLAYARRHGAARTEP